MESLEEIILKSGLKKKDIARILGKSRQTLSTWVNESRPEQIEEVKKAISSIHKNKFSATINEVDNELVKDLEHRIKELQYRITILENRVKDKEEIIELLKSKK